jgi:8-hydroxy-5-deazaflavin:NADPH oxidoreductase
VTVAEAIADAETIVLAVPGGAVAEIVDAHGAALDGKVVVDATNRMGAPAFNSRDAIAAAAPDAHYVRAFNTLGWENFAQPLPDADLFFAADPEARETAEALIAAVGLRPAYVGGGESATTVDALLPLWFALVQQRGGNRRVALRVVD